MDSCALAKSTRHYFKLDYLHGTEFSIVENMKLSLPRNLLTALTVLIFLTGASPYTAAAFRCTQLFAETPASTEPTFVEYTWSAAEVNNIDRSRDTFITEVWQKGAGEFHLTDRPAGGSQGGRWYTDRFGTRYFGKTYGGDQSRMITEFLVNGIYQAMGVNVPYVTLSKYKGKPILLSEEISNVDFTTKKIATGQELNSRSIMETDVKNNFIVDAWLANWDVIGLEYDNVLGLGEKAYGVDLGGTLFYRAQCGLKAFSSEVAEISTMRDPRYAGEVFGGLSDAEVSGQIRGLAARYSANRGGIHSMSFIFRSSLFI